MFVLVKLSTNQRQYFNTAEELVIRLMGVDTTKYRIEVRRFVEEVIHVVDIPKSLVATIDRLQYLAS